MPVALFALWWLASAFAWVNPYLLPRPEAVYQAFIELLKDGTLFEHIGASLGRAFGGYIAAALLALPMGYFFAKYETLHIQSRLILESLRMIPPLSLIPLLILWLGIGEVAKLTIVLLASFFPIYLNTLTAFRNVDRKLLEVGASLDFSRSEIFRLIMLPAAMPGILTGLRLGFGYSWRALVGAELIAASSGLGYLINESGEYLKTDCVFVGIITIALLGIAADRVLAAVLGRATSTVQRKAKPACRAKKEA